MTDLSKVPGGLGRCCFVVLAAAAVALGGCSNGQSSRTDRGGVGGGANTGTMGAEEILRDLDARYVVGPTYASQMGYRIAWNVSGNTTGTIETAHVTEESVFMVDTFNNLTRLTRDAGRRIWTLPVGAASDAVLGVVAAQRGGQQVIVALTEGDVHIFEIANGVQQARQPLGRRVAATAPLRYGDMIVYGSPNGQIVWHNFIVNSYVQGNSLRGTISTQPQRLGNLIIAVTEAGQVMAIDARSGAGLWSDFAREGIVAPAAISREAVYVTSLDQYLRCYSIASGRVRWERLHASQIDQPPVIVDDTVCVQIDGLGLACYEALPYEDLDGELLWNAEEVSGTVVARHGANLLAWDGSARTLFIVDAQAGHLVDQVHLPNAQRLLLDGFDSPEIFAIGDNGGVTRLVPK